MAKWGEKKPEREKKEEEEGSGKNVGAGVKTPVRRQELRRRASCHVTATSASSPRALASRRVSSAPEGLDFEIFHPETYL